MKFVLFALVVGLAWPAEAATTLPTVNKYVWNFNLVRWAATTSTYDSLAIRFFPSNKLSTNEFIKTSIFAIGRNEPFYSVNMTGSAIGADVIVPFLDTSMDNSLGGLQGRVELSMIIRGTVEIDTLTLYVRDGANEYYATTYAGVHLVPEPSIAGLSMSAAAFILCKRRRFIDS